MDKRAPSSRRLFSGILAAGLLASALSGCAGDASVPADGVDLRTNGGEVGALAIRSWAAEGRERAVILALHGFGESGELTFAGAGPFWAARGIAVYAPDQRGFGANPSRMRWPGGDALAADAVALGRVLRARHPGLPLVVVGHSMGGGVALIAATRGLAADGLVLAGPAIAGGAALNPVLRAGAFTMATLAPDRRWTGDGVVSIQPTDNIEAIRRALDDPRHFSDPSSRELWGLVRLMDAAAGLAPAVTTPTLTLMGARDEVLRPDRVRAVHQTIPGGVGFRVYPEGWHWLFSDLQAERVWRDVADFTLGLAP